MDKTVESYIREKEAKITNTAEKEKRDFLISQGLYKKVYVDIPEGVEPPEDVEWEYDSTLDIYKFYRNDPLPVTDEEYRKMLELNNQGKSSSNKNAVGSTLTVIAWVIYLAGFILGIIMGAAIPDIYNYDSEFNISLAMSYWAQAFIHGTLILGFAEMIKLLHDIKNK